MKNVDRIRPAVRKPSHELFIRRKTITGSADTRWVHDGMMGWWNVSSGALGGSYRYNSAPHARSLSKWHNVWPSKPTLHPHSPSQGGVLPLPLRAVFRWVGWVVRFKIPHCTAWMIHFTNVQYLNLYIRADGIRPLTIGAAPSDCYGQRRRCWETYIYIYIYI